VGFGSAGSEVAGVHWGLGFGGSEAPPEHVGRESELLLSRGRQKMVLVFNLLPTDMDFAIALGPFSAI
jgi:hypothetical protein